MLSVFGTYNDLDRLWAGGATRGRTEIWTGCSREAWERSWGTGSDGSENMLLVPGNDRLRAEASLQRRDPHCRDHGHSPSVSGLVEIRSAHSLRQGLISFADITTGFFSFRWQ